MVVEALLVGLAMFIVKISEWAGALEMKRPIVAGTIVGILLGHPVEGVIIAASIELVFLGSITVGGSVPQDVAVGAVLGTAYALLLGKGAEVAITLAVPISILGAFFYNILKLFYTTLVEKFDKYLDEENDKGFLKLFYLPLFSMPLVFGIVAFLGIYLGTNTIEAAINAIPTVIMNGLTVASGILPALGLGMLLKMLWQKNIALFFFAGFAMSAYLGLSTMGVAVFATCISIYICLADYEKKNQAAVVQYAGGTTLSEEEDFFNE